MTVPVGRSELRPTFGCVTPESGARDDGHTPLMAARRALPAAHTCANIPLTNQMTGEALRPLGAERMPGVMPVIAYDVE